MKKVCDVATARSTSRRFTARLRNTASAEAKSPPNTSRSGSASSAPTAAARACGSRPPPLRGSSVHATSRPTSRKTPTHALTAAASAALTYSHACRPRRPTPCRLRAAREKTIASPIASNARRTPESRAAKFEPRRRAVAASQGASLLTAVPRRRAIQATAATSPTVQRSALSPHGVARSSVSPAIPSATAVPSTASPSRVLSLGALIRRPPRARRRSGAVARGIRRSPRRDRRR